jgi:hypothetical protein
MYDLMFCWVGYQDVVKVKYRLLNANIVIEFLVVSALSKRGRDTCSAFTQRRSISVASAGRALCSSELTTLVPKNTLPSISTQEREQWGERYRGDGDEPTRKAGLKKYDHLNNTPAQNRISAIETSKSPLSNVSPNGATISRLYSTHQYHSRGSLPSQSDGTIATRRSRIWDR